MFSIFFFADNQLREELDFLMDDKQDAFSPSLYLTMFLVYVSEW